jgi:hypothetical protein
MFGPSDPITMDQLGPYLKGMPHALVMSVYCISKFHEKFRVTKACMDELERRGFLKEEMNHFDKQFDAFYSQMLEQNDL